MENTYKQNQFDDRPFEDNQEFNKLYDQHFFTSYYGNEYEGGLNQFITPNEYPYDNDISKQVSYEDLSQPYGDKPGVITDHAYNLGGAEKYDTGDEGYVHRTGDGLSDVNIKSEFDSLNPWDFTTKRKLSNQQTQRNKKENLMHNKNNNVNNTNNSRPSSIRQSSSSSIPLKNKNKIRPNLNKAYSYNNQSVEDLQTPKSSFEFHNTNKIRPKPNFRLNLNNLNDKSLFKFDNYSNQSLDDQNILDNDLKFSNTDEFDNLQEIITPSMKPPGSSNNDYFDDFLIPSSFDNLQKNTPGGDTSNTSNHNSNNEPENEPENEISFNENVDLSGFNFRLYDTANDEKLVESQFHSQSNSSDSHSHSNSPEKDKPLTPLSDLEHDDYNPSSTVSSHRHTSSNPSSLNYLDIKNEVHRTTSNQSTSSVNSISSNADKKKKKSSKGAHCSICGKYISRDLSRHIRIHNDIGRFQCVYPKESCSHKTGNFNRPYDYKKHLLHYHFSFDEKKGRTANNLTDKLPLIGTCKACGIRLTGNEWLENHVLTKVEANRCPYMEQR